MKSFYRLRDDFHGERAFLVGNGSTLTPGILDTIYLRGEFSFAMNKIAPMFYQTNWRPTFFVGVTTAWDDPVYSAHLLRAAEASALTFHTQGDDLDFPRGIALEAHFRDPDPDIPEEDWWFDNLEHGVSVFGTSMLAAQQIAAYLGFSELILVGVDGEYTGVSDHYMDSYRQEPMTEEQMEWANRDHRRAHVIGHSNLTRLGVRIVDASGGPLDVYPKVDFTSLF